MTWLETRSMICPHLQCRMVIPIRPDQTAHEAIRTHQILHHGTKEPLC